MTYDLLIHGGTVLTVNTGFDVIEDGIVGVSGDIVTLVTARDGVLPAARRVIDAAGGIIMPGLVNTHTHLPMTLFRGLADDLPLQRWLEDHMFPAEAAYITESTAKTGALLACAEMLLSGTTTCCDGYFFEGQVAAAVAAAGMRAVLGCGVVDFPAPGVPDPGENVAHAARFADDLAHRFPTVAPAVFCHAPYTCGERTLRRAKAAAAERGLLFQIHIAETRSERRQIMEQHAMTPVGYLDRLGLLDPNTLLVHAIWVDADDIHRIAVNGAAVSVTTQSEMKLASGIAPLSAFLAAGVRTGLGTDGAASNNSLDMFREMDMTAKIHKVHHLDPTCMDARTVLTLATRGGAEAIGLGRQVGSITVGKQADLIVVGTDQPGMTPLYEAASQVVYSAKGRDVRHVVVAGRPVVADGRLLTLPLEEILDAAQAVGQRIRSGKEPS